MNQQYGSTVWLIPDGYYPLQSSGQFVSHEAVCVLNLAPDEAEVEITLYFEDRPKMEGFVTTCPGERTRHIRMDQVKNRDGQGIPQGVPYAMMVKSSLPIVVQYSRMDTSQPAMALMTAIAYRG